MRLIDADKLSNDVFKYFSQPNYHPDADAFIATETEKHNEYIHNFLEEIEQQPTIEIPQWIPCSERLPEPEVNVLIYQIYNKTNQFAKITIGHLHQESDLRRKPYWEYIGYGQDMVYPKIESYHRADFICPGCEHVIAWQPL